MNRRNDNPSPSSNGSLPPGAILHSFYVGDVKVQERFCLPDDADHYAALVGADEWVNEVTGKSGGTGKRRG